MAIVDLPVSMGLDATSGLTKKRTFLSMDANIRTKTIKVFYEEYFETTTGAKVNCETKNYTVKDSAIVYYKKGELKTPAVKTAEGVITTHATYYDGTEVLLHASTKFTDWFNQLGKTVIVPAVNAALSNI